MNIPDSIWKVAEKMGGFDWIATGGGIDYITRNIGVNSDGSTRVAFLKAREDAGSPDNLRIEKATVVIPLDEHWRDNVYIDVANAFTGLQLMVGIETIKSG